MLKVAWSYQQHNSVYQVDGMEWIYMAYINERLAPEHLYTQVVWASLKDFCMFSATDVYNTS